MTSVLIAGMWDGVRVVGTATPIPSDEQLDALETGLAAGNYGVAPTVRVAERFTFEPGWPFANSWEPIDGEPVI